MFIPLLYLIGMLVIASVLFRPAVRWIFNIVDDGMEDGRPKEERRWI